MEFPPTSGSKWKAFFKKKKNPLSVQQLVSNTDSKAQESEKDNLKKQLKIQNIQERKQEKQCHSQPSKITSDIKPEQHKNTPQTIQKGQEFSTGTRKILSILQTKQTKKPQIADEKCSQKSNQTKPEQKSFDDKKEIQERTKTKLKSGHYKIYNPQHFVVKNEEIKTSIHRWTYGSGSTPNQLLIHSWNINGIRARMANNDILPYLEFHKPDILCVNETKLDEKSFLENPYKFWGYHSYWNFPKFSLGYSGVAVFSKYPAIQMIEDIHLPEHSKEGRVITLEFDKFVLINIYAPTVGRQLQRLDYRVKEYDPAFFDYVLKTKDKFPSKTLIICGDLNVAHEQLDCHTGKRMKEGKQPAYTIQERMSFTNLLKQTNLVDTFRHFHPKVREYTWWNMRRGGRKRNGETGIGKRLDYFLVDSGSMKYVKSSEIRKEVQGCDHCPIELRLEFK